MNDDEKRGEPRSGSLSERLRAGWPHPIYQLAGRTPGPAYLGEFTSDVSDVGRRITAALRREPAGRSVAADVAQGDRPLSSIVVGYGNPDEVAAPTAAVETARPGAGRYMPDLLTKEHRRFSRSEPTVLGTEQVLLDVDDQKTQALQVESEYHRSVVVHTTTGLRLTLVWRCWDLDRIQLEQAKDLDRLIAQRERVIEAFRDDWDIPRGHLGS